MCRQKLVRAACVDSEAESDSDHEVRVGYCGHHYRYSFSQFYKQDS